MTGVKSMNYNFIITQIRQAIFVCKNEYPHQIVRFTDNLYCHELIYHIDGESTVYFNDKVLEIEADTVRFLPKGENRKYIVESKQQGDCIDIFFDTDIPISGEAFAIKLSENTIVGNLFKKLFSVWVSKNEGYYFECVSLLYKIFAQMQKQNYIPQNQYNTIKPAIEHIEENFLKDKISVPYLAKMCTISVAYLKKLFLKKFGVSPIKYIIQLKVNHACDLLRSGRYTITQVSDICGYDNVYYFSRQFREYMGISPTEFKNKYKSSK